MNDFTPEEQAAIPFLLPVLQSECVWCVDYADGTSLWQYDAEHPDGQPWSDVDDKQVAMLSLLTANMAQIHRVMVPHGASPVFFKRGSVAFNLQTEERTPLPVAHCIGWKQGESGVYLFIFDNGETLLTSDFQAV